MFYSTWCSPWQSGPARKSAGRTRRFKPSLEHLEQRLSPALYTVNALSDAGTVGSGNTGDIRYVINKINASPGATDTIHFSLAAGSVISLTHGELSFSSASENVTITGPGASLLTISGAGTGVNAGKASRVFDISNASDTVAISGLTISGGNGSTAFLAAPGTQGGNILNVGTLTLTGDVVSNGKVVGAAGTAVAAGGTASGGGIYNSAPGTLIIDSTKVLNNVAQGGAGSTGASPGQAGGSGGSAFGGGIYSSSALTIRNGSTFSNNQALGGDGGRGADGANSTPGLIGGKGGPGGHSGAAQGGAVYFDVAGPLNVTGGSFTSNQAVSGHGGQGGNGGIGGASNGEVAAKGGAGGTGGDSYSAWGGAIAAAGSNTVHPIVKVTGTSFTSNQAISNNPGAGGAGGQGGAGAGSIGGGAGGQGGNGGSNPASSFNNNSGRVPRGGAIAMVLGGGLTIQSASFTSNQVVSNFGSNGGAGGRGGQTGSTGGTGGTGGNGGQANAGNNQFSDTFGGAISTYNSGNLSVTATPFTSNKALSSTGGIGGKGGDGGPGVAGVRGGSGGIGGTGGNSSSAWGGAIANTDTNGFTGNLTLINSPFVSNLAQSGNGGAGGNSGNGVDGGNGGSVPLFSQLEKGGQGASSWGGAVVNKTQSGADTVTDCAFTSNSALSGNGGAGGKGGAALGTTGDGGKGGQGGAGDSSWGGALWNDGQNTSETLTFNSSPFSNNRDVSGAGGRGGDGGNASAVGRGGDGGQGGQGDSSWGGGLEVSNGGQVTLNNSPFTNNYSQVQSGGRGGNGGNGAIGGNGGNGGVTDEAWGGGISNDGANGMTLSNSPLTGNKLIAGPGGAGGSGGVGSTGTGGKGGDGGASGGSGSNYKAGWGGGLEMDSSGALIFNTSNVTNNSIIGAQGGAGGVGGVGATAGGPGGNGGNARGVVGGGVYASTGSLQINNSHIDNNKLYGGAGGAGGAGGKTSTIRGTVGASGKGGDAGLAAGGGVYDNDNSSATDSITGSTVSNNTITGVAPGTGPGGHGAAGTSAGGGVYVTGPSFIIDSSTLCENDVTGANGDKGGGGGLYVTNSSSVTIRNNTTICCNTINGTQGGGGILIGNQVTTTTISNSSIYRNKATGGNGGGLNAGNTSLTLTSDTIERNLARAGGGVFESGGTTDLLTKNIIAGNFATTGVGPDLEGSYQSGGGDNIIGVSGGFTGIDNSTGPVGHHDRVGTPTDMIPPPIEPPLCPDDQPSPPPRRGLGFGNP